MKHYAFKFDWLQISVKPDYIIHDHDGVVLEHYLDSCFQDLRYILPEGCTYQRAKVNIRHYRLTKSITYEGQLICNISVNKVEEGIAIAVVGGHHDICVRLIQSDLFNNSLTRVMRVDLALDIYEDDYSFDAFTAVLNGIANDNGYVVNTAGDWLNKKSGRTLYVGNRKSFSMIRWYEKSIQLGLDETERKFNRLEFELKPTKVSPVDPAFLAYFNHLLFEYAQGQKGLSFFQFSSLAIQTINHLDGVDLEPLSTTEKKPKDALRSVVWMLIQFRNSVAALRETHDFDLNELFERSSFSKQIGTTDPALKSLFYDYFNKSKKGASFFDDSCSLESDYAYDNRLSESFIDELRTDHGTHDTTDYSCTVKDYKRHKDGE